MSPRARRALIAAVAAVAAVAVAGAVAVLPGSGPGGARIAVRGATSGPRRALDLSGPAGLAGGPTDTTETTSTPIPDTTVSPTSTTGPPRPPATTPSPSSTARPATTTTVATAPPATGRLALTQVLPNGARGIATMAADGSGERVLATGDYIDPHWTPDGRFVQFESLGAYASWVVPAAGGPVTRLGEGAVGVISPDGTSVINVMAVPYASGPPPLTVQKIAETATGWATVGPPVPLGVAGVGPVWSPDGRRILFHTEMGGSSDLAVVNADGTGRHDLLAWAPVKASGVDHPGFSADGSTISFLGSDATVYFIGSDGQDLRPVLSGAFATVWSADRQRLAVLVSGGNSVVVVNPSRHVLATAHLTVGAFPVGIALDGSGQYVYYMGFPANPSQPSRLYSIALAGGASQRVGTDDWASFPLTVHPG